jgi:hypothetical protein
MMNQVAAWNGTGWGSLGTGTGGTLFRPIVRCAAVYNGTLFVGGWFHTAGGTPSRYLANWTAPPPGPGTGTPPAALAAPAAPATPAAEERSFARVPAPGRLQGLSLSPNPLRAGTQVSFRLGNDAPVSVAVYDAGGRRVAALADRDFAAGRHRIHWDGRDDHGAKLPSGVYFVSLRSGGERIQRKAVLVAQ